MTEKLFVRSDKLNNKKDIKVKYKLRHVDSRIDSSQVRYN